MLHMTCMQKHACRMSETTCKGKHQVYNITYMSMVKFTVLGIQLLTLRSVAKAENFFSSAVTLRALDLTPGCLIGITVVFNCVATFLSSS
jgi:hypothetical protein